MRRNREQRAPSRAELLLRAHPNSAAKKYGLDRPGATLPEDIDRLDMDALGNTGFPDDYKPLRGYQYADDPYQALIDEWDAEDAGRKVAELETAWDLGVSLPEGHPFAPVVDGLQAA